jgi:hypothetical protein
MALTRQSTKKPAMAMKRARVDSAMATAKETRVAVTAVAAMMANGTKDSARPHNNQLRGTDDNNSKGNKEDEGSKGNGDSGYSDNVNERDCGGSNDGKHEQRQRFEGHTHPQPLKKLHLLVRGVVTHPFDASARSARPHVGR